MRAASGLSIYAVCLSAMLGCASPQPAAPTAATTTELKETDKQRAQRLINYSAESGEPINTADGQRLICKKESVTNTRLKNKKICLTPDQWQERVNNAKNSLEEARDSGEYLPPKGN